MDYLHHFRLALLDDVGTPELPALFLAAALYPELEIPRIQEQLDTLALQMQHQLDPSQTGEALAWQIITVFARDLGFVGNRHEYYDARNGYLHQVLARRTGLPITLSLLLSALVRRLGIHLDGMGYPAHFMLRYADGDGEWILDPYYGEVLMPDQVVSHLTDLFGEGMELGPASLYGPISARAWMHRILNNLLNIYGRQNEPERVRRLLDFLLVVEPGSMELWRNRGVLAFHARHYLAARRDLRRYLYLKGHLAGEAAPISVMGPPGMPPEREIGVDADVESILAAIDRKLLRIN